MEGMDGVDDHGVRWMAWEHGRHGRYGRPWQIAHADSTIPLGVSPPSPPLSLHSPAARSFWRASPASLAMLPRVLIALHALARPTCSYPCPWCSLVSLLGPRVGPVSCSLTFSLCQAKTPSPTFGSFGSSAAQRRSWFSIRRPPLVPVGGGCCGRVPAADGIHHGIVSMGRPVLS